MLVIKFCFKVNFETKNRSMKAQSRSNISRGPTTSKRLGLGKVGISSGPMETVSRKYVNCFKLMR